MKNNCVIPQNIIQQQATEQNCYFVADTETTEKELYTYMFSHLDKTLYMTSVNHQDFLILPIIMDDDVQMISVYLANPYTELAEIADFETVRHLLLDKKQTLPEIYGKQASIFLDKYNLEYYENIALQLLHTHPDTRPLNYLSEITGKEYYEKIQELIQAAYRIMDGTLVPDIITKLPMEKDGTFSLYSKIPVVTYS